MGNARIMCLQDAGRSVNSSKRLRRRASVLVSGLLLLVVLAPFSSASFAGEDSIGPVSADQTLWSIASQNRPDPSVTVYQYMLALVEANPHAFAANNVNLLREGVILQLPDVEFATRTSAEDARRQVDEQMQWYANLSRQELLEILRSAPAAPPPPSQDAMADVQDTPREVPTAPVIAPEQRPEPEVMEPTVPESERPEPEVMEPTVPEPERPEIDDWAVPSVPSEPEAINDIDDQPLRPDAAPEASGIGDDAEARILATTPDQTEPGELVEDLRDEAVPDPVLPETEATEWAVEPQPEPAEPAVVEPRPAPTPAATPLPQTAPTTFWPDLSWLFWLAIIVVTLLLVVVLTWWRRRSAQRLVDEPAESDGLADLDEARFPTAAAAGGAEKQSGSDADPGVAADDQTEQPVESSSAASRAGDSSWSGLEAAVIASGPVPVGDTDPDPDPRGDADADNHADTDTGMTEDAPPTRSVDSDVMGEKQAPLSELDADKKRADEDESSANFPVDELGWFEDESFSSDVSEDENLSVAVDPSASGPAETAAEETGLEDIDLSSFRDRDDALADSADAQSDDDLLEDIDLAELRDSDDEEPPETSQPNVTDDGPLLDLDLLRDSEPEPSTPSDQAPEQLPDLDWQPEPEPDAEPVSGAGGEPEELLDLDLDLEPESQLEPATEPQPEPGAAAETDSASATLDDQEAEVMLDLARLTADAGDTDYAREVLDEIIESGSEDMVRRARELKDSLD